MDTMNTLRPIAQREIEAYASAGWQTRDYIISDVPHQTFSVIVVPDEQRQDIKHPIVVVMAHIDNDQVVIDEDITDRPLSLALQAAGIPPEKIVVAYLGRRQPEAGQKASSNNT